MMMAPVLAAVVGNDEGGGAAKTGSRARGARVGGSCEHTNFSDVGMRPALAIMNGLL